jgi:hypothetical protein
MGKRCELYTDHKSLKYILHSRTKTLVKDGWSLSKIMILGSTTTMGRLTWWLTL